MAHPVSDDGVPSTPRNAPLYERLGFEVVEEADSPEGGPHVWFMRREP